MSSILLRVSVGGGVGPLTSFMANSLCKGGRATRRALRGSFYSGDVCKNFRLQTFEREGPSKTQIEENKTESAGRDLSATSSLLRRSKPKTSFSVRESEIGIAATTGPGVTLSAIAETTGSGSRAVCD